MMMMKQEMVVDGVKFPFLFSFQFRECDVIEEKK